MKKRSRKLSAVVLAGSMACILFISGGIAQAEGAESEWHSMHGQYHYNDFWQCYDKEDVEDLSDASVTQKARDYWDTVHISKASVSRKKGTVGDTLTYRMVIKDNGLKALADSDPLWKYEERPFLCMSDVTLNLAAQKSGQRLDVDLKRVRTFADGSQEWKGSIKIRKGMQPGKWIVQSMEVDSPLFGFSSRDQSGNPGWPDLSWGNFMVTGTKADLTAPKIIRLKNRKVSKRRTQLRWKVSDASRVRCYLYYTDDLLETPMKKSGKYYKTTESNEELGHITLVAVDDWGNQVRYTLKKGKWVNPEQTKRVSSRISVRKITRKKPTVKPGEVQKITLSMKWKKFIPESIKIDYRAPYAYAVGNSSATVQLKAKNRSKTKWSGIFQTKPTSRKKGTWCAEKISLVGKNSKGKRVSFNIENSKWMPSSHVGSGYLRADLSGGNICVQ